MVQEVSVVVGIMKDRLFVAATIVEVVVVSLNVRWPWFGHFQSLCLSNCVSGARHGPNGLGY